MLQTATEARKAAELEAIEHLKKSCREDLKAMQPATPSEAERLSQRIKDSYLKDTRLPLDFKRAVSMRAREYECQANMRAADACLRHALDLAQEENFKERGQFLAQGRKFAAKAIALGAGEDFRKATDRMAENIMLTGGVAKKGPTRAKPDFHTPSNPHRAKS
ncbi:MAG: hypothetical protein K2Q10_00690 [Rhodospirillales bacterium]|nr:hypothetical protein [Rhodospirillales bacterium]